MFVLDPFIYVLMLVVYITTAILGDILKMLDLHCVIYNTVKCTQQNINLNLSRSKGIIGKADKVRNLECDGSKD